MKSIFLLILFFVAFQAIGQTWQKTVIITKEKPAYLSRDSFFLITTTRVTDLKTGKFTEVSEGVIFADTAAVGTYVSELAQKRDGVKSKLATMQAEIAVYESMIRQATEQKMKLPTVAMQTASKPIQKPDSDKPPNKKKKKKGGG